MATLWEINNAIMACVDAETGEIIDFDEETLEKGSIECPECGELLEFSLEEDEDETMPF